MFNPEAVLHYCATEIHFQVKIFILDFILADNVLLPIHALTLLKIHALAKVPFTGIFTNVSWKVVPWLGKSVTIGAKTGVTITNREQSPFTEAVNNS